MARAARITEKDAAEKLARQRLSVLELAQALGSVSEACRGDRGKVPDAFSPTFSRRQPAELLESACRQHDDVLYYILQVLQRAAPGG